MRARRERFALAGVGLIAGALVACEGDEKPYGLGYNKGCPNLAPQCDHSYYGYDAAAPEAEPPFVAPEGCPSNRTDAPRADLTTNDVRALLPGVYESCSTGRTLRVDTNAHGQLEADGETIVVGACGTTGCDAAWREAVGTLQIWAEPAAFSFVVDTEVDSYVRQGD